MSTQNVKKVSEIEIQSSICEYLSIKRRFFFRLNNIPSFNKGANGSITMRRLPKYTPRGLPDIIVVAGGAFIALEVKSAIGKQSPDQKIIQQDIERHSGRYYVVRSVEDVIKIGL